MMLAGEGSQALSQADKAHGQSTMLQHLCHAVIRADVVRINPHALSHEERIIAPLLAALYLEAVQQLAEYQLNQLIQLLIELLDVMACLDSQARQVDAGKAQVAPATGNSFLRVVHVAHNPGTAAHICHLGVIIPRLVILQVKRCIQKAEIREQPLGGGLHGLLEQIVVRIPRIVVDTFLDLENLHRENRRLTIAKPSLGSLQQVAHHHPRLRGGIRAVVDGAERHLGTGTGIHGVQVVNQCLHGLEGSPVRSIQCRLHRKLVGTLRLIRGNPLKVVACLMMRQEIHQPLTVLVHIGHGNLHRNTAANLPGQQAGILHLHHENRSHEGSQILKILLAEGLCHSRSHGIIKIRHRLAAVHLVLIGLNGNARQSRIRADIIWLPEEAMSSRKTALEQLQEVNLAAGLRQHVKILVVDVDIAVSMGCCNILRQNIVVNIILGTLGAIFQHGAHGSIRINIGILTLDVRIGSLLEGQLIIDVHQIPLSLAHLGVLRPVKNERLGSAGVIMLNQHLLHSILDKLHCRNLLAADGSYHIIRKHIQNRPIKGFVDGLQICLVNGVFYLFSDKWDNISIAFSYILHTPTLSV